MITITKLIIIMITKIRIRISIIVTITITSTNITATIITMSTILSFALHVTSHVTRHSSHVTRHTSLVTRHASLVTRHTSHREQFYSEVGMLPVGGTGGGRIKGFTGEAHAMCETSSHVTRHTSHVTLQELPSVIGS